MDIARDICTDSFYIVNSGLPCIAVTAVDINQIQNLQKTVGSVKMHVTLTLMVIWLTCFLASLLAWSIGQLVSWSIGQLVMSVVRVVKLSWQDQRAADRG